MTGRIRAQLVAAVVCAASAIALLQWPMDWIERLWEVAPDGERELELLPVAALALVSLVLFARVGWALRGRQASPSRDGGQVGGQA